MEREVFVVEEQYVDGTWVPILSMVSFDRGVSEQDASHCTRKRKSPHRVTRYIPAPEVSDEP